MLDDLQIERFAFKNLRKEREERAMDKKVL